MPLMFVSVTSRSVNTEEMIGAGEGADETAPAAWRRRAQGQPGMPVRALTDAIRGFSQWPSSAV
jgi:hypothetical protein